MSVGARSGGYADDSAWQIDEGSGVMTADGERLGSVENAHPCCLVVDKGLLFHTEHYVPVFAITSVAAGSVYLGFEHDEVEQQVSSTVRREEVHIEVEDGWEEQRRP
ncbi:MAG TPA: hypothetical protein VMM78_07000 [Thermomicrobiales bacterium]|nr:hypothetical protein [Thermomicrobiales bacterium]